MKRIKYLYVLFVTLLCTNKITAQDDVNFEIDRSFDIESSIPVSAIEQNTSKLLTTINKAETAASSSIDFTGINITDDAANSLAMIWSNVRFRVIDDDIIQKCLTLKSKNNVRGYEVSNIAVEMKPLDDSFQENLNQEITISFNKQGAISDVVISMGIHQYASMMKGAKNLEDIDKRMQILHYVEQFRTAYCQKDINFLNNVFSDDALIVTGRVQRRVKAETGLTSVVEYTKQTKREYLTKLAGTFSRNKYVNVKFDDISVEHNPINQNIYGVTLRQEWNSSTYSDVGTVFLLWDFTNEEAPKIYVRTWQPLEDTHRFKTTEFDL